MSKNNANVAEIPVKKTKQKSSDRALTIDNAARHLVTNNVYDLAPFPKKLLISSPQPGEHLFYEQVRDDRVIRKINRERVVDLILEWISNSWGIYPDLLGGPQLAKDICRTWTGIAPKIDGVVKSFEFADGQDYVTHRVPFVPDLTATFEHIDLNNPTCGTAFPYVEFLSRCSSPDQVAAFIGSIFYQESYMQQYLTIWGEGNDGKGSLVRALQKVLAEAFHADSFEFMGRFWTSAFIGKRLIVFPDNNDQKAMQSGMWKQLTGGDSVRVEVKKEATFTAKLNAKFLITSNFAPVLKMDRADQRRAIVVRVDQIHGDIDPEVERRMAEWDQLKFLVEYSCWVYRKLCGGHRPIPVEDAQVDLIQNADEEIEQRMISELRFGAGYVLPISSIHGAVGDRYAINRIARILTQRFGCVKFQARDGGKYSIKKVYYVGVGLRNATTPEGTNMNTMHQNAVKELQIYKDAVKKLPRNLPAE